MAQTIIEREQRMEERSAYAIAIRQLEAAAHYLNLDRSLLEVLKHPRRELIVNFPVKMDDGSIASSRATASTTTLRAVLPREASATIPKSRWTRCARWRCG
jgi:hypothetical protein